jgi:two-component system sensor histidine kinase/response regulator
MENDPLLNQNIPSILLIDDIPANLKGLGDILEGNGYKVRPVTNGILALKVAEKEKPDLILLDIMMPDIDGYEVCRRLKENENLKDVPIIFISALSDTQDIVKAFHTGGVDYITKPFQAEEILARVTTHIKICRQSTELQKLIFERNRFISILAHDLKNPFTGLISITEALLNANITDIEQVRKFSLTIHNIVLQQYKLLNNLLEWSRLQIGSLKPETKECDINSIIQDIIELYQPITSNKNLTLHTFISDESRHVKIDSRMLDTVLRNLISNAIKFTNQNGKIKISAIKDNEYISISVEDNGVGIDKDNISKLFNIGVSYSNPGTNNEQGTGLGLILSKELIKKNNGNILVESNLGKGSKFTIKLPVF